MDDVWAEGEATVADVHARMSRRRKIAYTTVMTTMQNLEKRGLLVHEARGKAYLYRPALTREQFAAHAISGLIDRVFDGKPEGLFCYLLGDERVTPQYLNRLKRLLKEQS
jgi:predicted transcriptional regulator